MVVIQGILTLLLLIWEVPVYVYKRIRARYAR